MKQNIDKNKINPIRYLLPNGINIYFLSFWLIILLAALVRIVAFSISENSILGDMQPMDRILIVKQWLNIENIIIPALNFGPLHLGVLRILFIIFDQHILVARLNSLFFGLALFFVYYLFVKTTFKDKKVALFSILFLAISPVNVLTSVISQAMSMFTFFIILSLVFFMRLIYKRGCILINLILSVLFLNLANMVRFEGWLFIPILSLILIFKNDIKTKFAFLFLLLSLIFPSFWILFNYFTTTNPFYFLHISEAVLKYEMANVPLSNRIFGWPGTLLKSLGPFVAITCITGIVLAFKLKKYLFNAVLFFIIFAIFVFRTIAGEYDYSIMTRSSILVLLLIPYAGWIMYYLWDKRKHYIRIMLVTYLLITISFNLSYVIKNSFASKANPQAKEALQFIDKICYSNRIILIDEFDGGYRPYFIVKSKFPVNHFLKLPIYFTKGKIKIDEQALLNLISQQKSEYIISAPYACFVNSDVFKDLRIKEKINLVFSNSKYLIYKLIYEENNLYYP